MSSSVVSPALPPAATASMLRLAIHSCTSLACSFIMPLSVSWGLWMTVPKRFFLTLPCSFASVQHAWSLVTYTCELSLYQAERRSSTSDLMGLSEPLTKLMTPDTLDLQSDTMCVLVSHLAIRGRFTQGSWQGGATHPC